jgi:hypothetical protein
MFDLNHPNTKKETMRGTPRPIYGSSPKYIQERSISQPVSLSPPVLASTKSLPDFPRTISSVKKSPVSKISQNLQTISLKGSLFENVKYISKLGDYIAIKNVNPSNQGIHSSTLREMHALAIMKGCPNILQIIDVKYELDNGNTMVSMMLTYHTGDLTTFYKTVPYNECIKYF